MRSFIDVVQLTVSARFVRETASMFRQASEIASEYLNLEQRHNLIQVVVLLSLVALFAMLTPSVQGQGGCEFVIDHPEGHALYIQIPADKTITSSPTTYLDPGCNTVDPLSLTEPPWFIRDGLVSAPDAETARKLCQSINTGPIQKVKRWAYTNSVFMCWAGRADGRATDSEATDGSGGCPIGIDLLLDGLRLDAFDGMNSGIQFRRLGNCGVGDPNVIAMGFLDAVDIWSNVGSGYSVCFPQEGRIVFLDAATSPRSLVFPDYHFDDGWTCASLDRAGTMVLVKSSDTASSAAATTTSATVARRPGTDDSVDDAIALEDCLVTPRVNLRLREAPWGQILDVVPRDTAVEAHARTQSWFNVTYLEQEGWMAAWLADSEGDCDWTNTDIEGEDE